MAVLIPAMGACVGRMTPGERRLAERLEQKLEDDYMLWYDVPIGPKQTHPDFVVIHPRRGILILETKDWRLETVQEATKQAWTLIVDGRPKVVINPAAQARHCAIQVVNALERDQQLIHGEGPHQGKLAFPGAAAWCSPTSRASSLKSLHWTRRLMRIWSSARMRCWNPLMRRLFSSACGTCSPRFRQSHVGAAA